MKLRAVLAGAFIAGVAMGGCASSQADLETTRSDLAAVTGERDGLERQLDTDKIARIRAEVSGRRPDRRG
jgi:hypothetical protein